MSNKTTLRIVFGCPACKKRSEWPKTAFGELEKAFKCSICGASGCENDGCVVEKLLDVLESDDLARENAAAREKALEALAE